MATQATFRSAARRGRALFGREALAWAALGALLLVAAAFLLHESRGTTFWVDEWNWIQDRRGSGVDTFLEPHNEHLSLIPVVLYKLLFAAVGLEDYAPYRMMVIAAHLGCAVLVFVYVRRRAGSPAGLCVAAILLFLGPAWQNVIWPFQVAWLISLAAGIGALLALDMGDRRGEIAASVLLGMALASSGLGIAILAGVLVELLWERRGLRVLWIVALPAIPYAIWWLAYHPAGLVKGNIDQVPHFTADAAAGALSALAGLTGSNVPDLNTLEWGRPLAVVMLAGLVWSLVRRPRIPPRVAALLAILLAFWVLTALRRAMLSQPDASRYLYVGGLFIMLLGAELVRGHAMHRRAALLVGPVVAAIVLSNAGVMRDGGRYLRVQAESARADLAALDIVRGRVEPGYVSADFPGTPFIALRPAAYYAAGDALGSPAYTPTALAGAPEPARLVADRELMRVLDVRLRRPPASPRLGQSPQVDPGAGGASSSSGACVGLRPAAPYSSEGRPALEVTVPADGVLILADGGPARVDVRRFAAGYAALRMSVVPSGGSAILRIPADRAAQPWHASVTPQGRVSVCGLR